VRNEAIAAGLTGFLVHDQAFEEIRADWQATGHDRACVERLRAVHVGIQPVLHHLTLALERFGAYLPRLAAELHRLDDGDDDAFASYHDVWAELHDDLLATLGQTRPMSDGGESGPR
jgi:hypothetical protein